MLYSTKSSYFVRSSRKKSKTFWRALWAQPTSTGGHRDLRGAIQRTGR